MADTIEKIKGLIIDSEFRRNRHEMGIRQCNKELDSLRKELVLQEELLERISGIEIQSSVYVARGYDLGQIQYGEYPNLPDFPMFGTGHHRKFSLGLIPEHRLKDLPSVLQSNSIEKQPLNPPPINFDGKFIMKEYAVYYLDSLISNPATLRIGVALPYSRMKQQFKKYKTIPGHYNSGPGFDDWIPEETIVVSVEEKTVCCTGGCKAVPMAIISARTSSDLDALRIKLALY